MTTAVSKVLDGMIDMHCHPGPNPLPRLFDHYEAARDAGRLNMRAILVKSHHHNTVMDVLSYGALLRDVNTDVFGGIALNCQVGGINPYAVELSLRMGGKAVWFPTISSAPHIRHLKEGGRFPQATIELSEQVVDIRGKDGELLPEVDRVLDLVLESGAFVSGGHMAFEDIRSLFEAARAKGITRMVLNHPGSKSMLFTYDQVRELIGLGAYVEQVVAQFDPGAPNSMYTPADLMAWIEVTGPERTVLASDLGQKERSLPVDAFLRTAEALLDLGLAEADLRRMTSTNPAYLLALEEH